ncbi:leucyl/phenylalanyl-tRNA--protein transferase [Friedmanniella endophytica]|uniref:Leucyl/phenylalanyl-tRNA--protein transferase n=1 Tax=Microlunatus kandeliicorticis TaxID=1759536 RepID=A0A7W3IRG5_9ACTN|nr:leucyl/phenylalanyl-tRNA--protein transferase [Microlunatus kandeliicorticis]MBA8793833.1 leucyl/phenylalanyl-tRNA--protein transferase [Microlunatus kandeliicorticis]
MAGRGGSPFPPTNRWPESDLIAVSEHFDAELVLAGYRRGVFPMPQGSFRGRWLMGWFAPVDRAVLPLDGLRVTRSLRQSAKHYTLSVDRAFGEVLDRCADPRRPGGWIDRRIRRTYLDLFDRGIAHSVECWTAAGELAGGLYGVGIGGLFAGESMFHRPDIGRDASKVALVELVRRLSADGLPRLLDVQWQTGHLRSLGAVEIGREEYLRRLAAALALPEPDWTP